ncbi:MAG: hypothetical protein AB1599_03905 [Planctomycetota bacterium]
MNEPRIQLSEDTWAYVDRERSKLVVEIDLPVNDGGQSADEKIDLPELHQMN